MAQAVDFIVNQVEGRDLTNIVLVSHSWGGYPATAAAARLASRISKVVYYSAVVPESGIAMADESKQLGQVVRTAIASTSDATVPMPLDAIRTVMMQDATAQMQELVFGMCVAQPGAYMVESVIPRLSLSWDCRRLIFLELKTGHLCDQGRSSPLGLASNRSWSRVVTLGY